MSDPLGRPVAARWLVLPDGTAVRRGGRGDRAAPPGGGRAGSAARLEPGARGADPAPRCESGRTALLVCLGGTATVDGGAGLLRGDRPRSPRSGACGVRRREPAARRRAARRAPSGRRRARRPKRWTSWRRGSRRRDELRPVRRPARRRRRRRARRRARRARRGAGLGRGARARARSGSVSARGTRSSSSPGRGPSIAATLEGKAPGAVAARLPRRRASAALSSAAASGERLPGVEAARSSSGDPARARRRLVLRARRAC